MEIYNLIWVIFLLYFRAKDNGTRQLFLSDSGTTLLMGGIANSKIDSLLSTLAFYPFNI